MSLLYLNTGYKDIFNNSTFNNNDSFVYNYDNGVAVNEGEGTISLADTISELCGKFDIYSSFLSLDNISINIGSLSGFTLYFESGNCLYKDMNSVIHSTPYSAEVDNYLWFYIVPSSSELNDGVIQIVLNDELLVDIENANITFNQGVKIKVSSSDPDVYLSNFIFTDFLFDYSCRILDCQFSSIDTDMSVISEGYKVTVTGQKIMQKIDLSKWYSIYGDHSDVYGFYQAGIYTDVSPENNIFSSIEKDGSSYSKTSSVSLNGVASGCVSYSRKFSSKMTLSSVHNRSYGWLAE